MKNKLYFLVSISCLAVVLCGCPKKEEATQPISDEEYQYKIQSLIDSINSEYLHPSSYTDDLINNSVALAEKNEKDFDRILTQLASDNPSHILYMVKLFVETTNQSIKAKVKLLLQKVSPDQITFKENDNTFIKDALTLLPQENTISDAEVKNITISVKKAFRTRPLSSVIDKTDSVGIKKILQTMLDNEVSEIRIKATGPDELSNSTPMTNDIISYHSSDFTNIRKSIGWVIENKLTSAREENEQVLENMIKMDDSV
ncbi:MAG: hypothetical protein AAB019_08395, partial [Planctomycetota bacterium]